MVARPTDAASDSTKTAMCNTSYTRKGLACIGLIWIQAFFLSVCCTLCKASFSEQDTWVPHYITFPQVFQQTELQHHIYNYLLSKQTFPFLFLVE